jgi:hypothetical protein
MSKVGRTFDPYLNLYLKNDHKIIIISFVNTKPKGSIHETCYEHFTIVILGRGVFSQNST